MNATTLAQALSLADAAASVREAAAALRLQFTPMKVVVVDADDMRTETPAAQGERRALYLGTSDGHCWQVTQDPAQAVGLFIADRRCGTPT
ncbi:MAG: hypothetical protein Q7T97_07535 [Burkholderiaceae bacterium]|nr:hypothetical protein [Burkholderiaceae bacterium]